MPLPVTDPPPTFDEWCVIELYGHRRAAGHVREVQIAGAGMLRLDIPAVNGQPSATQFYAMGAVYGLHPTTEQIATAAATRFRPEPVQRWELPALAAAAGFDPDVPDLDDDFDDDGVVDEDVVGDDD